MKNHLKDQSSPYLLQHAENPVDWYPWGEEAFERAAREDKPIFLSVGYSTCHWCHVMAEECFENRKIAQLLNRYFVSVKVDREERPDIDSVYMSVCQAFTGSGGWPMSIFMTADQKPFFAGTYFPPKSQYGRMGFDELLLVIAQKWSEEREKLLESADNILQSLKVQTDQRQNIILQDGKELLNDQAGERHEETAEILIGRAVSLFADSFDAQCGGFGSAPKFPLAHNLLFLMLYAQLSGQSEPLREAVVTLEKLRRGGIFDQIGYGFSRYSTDRYYLVPHFEKMLYDNALLIMAYAAAYRITANRMFLDTAEQTAEYIFREMTGDDGEFYSAQDADSEGEEGKFYVWRYKEICDVLGAEKGRQFAQYFGITKRGNFEGNNIPNLLDGADIADLFAEERKTLYAYRKERTRLHLDDKILTSWNSLMICALSLLFRVTGKKRYLSAAQNAHQFIENNLADGTTLYVSCRKGIHSGNGFLEDYAYYTAALLFLYDAVSEKNYLRRAEEICAEVKRQFADENGGYFLYGDKNSTLITRPKETYDGALPSGNSVMAYCLVRLYQLTGSREYETAVKRQSAFLMSEAAHYPAGYSVFLTAELFYLHPPKKITVVLAKEDTKEQLLPGLPLYADITFLTEETGTYRILNHKTTYYVCDHFTCFAPVNVLPE